MSLLFDVALVIVLQNVDHLKASLCKVWYSKELVTPFKSAPRVAPDIKLSSRGQEGQEAAKRGKGEGCCLQRTK